MAEFKKQFLGYDIEQVDQVIRKLDEMVTDQTARISDLEKQVAEKDSKLEDLRKRVSEYEEKEVAIEKALISAKRVATNMVSQAEQQSGGIVADAENRSKDLLEQTQKQQDQKLRKTEETVQEMVKTGDDKLQEMRIEYSTWVARHNEAREKYKAMLEAQLNLLADEKYQVDNFGLPDISKLDTNSIDTSVD